MTHVFFHEEEKEEVQFVKELKGGNEVIMLDANLISSSTTATKRRKTPSNEKLGAVFPLDAFKENVEENKQLMTSPLLPAKSNQPPKQVSRLQISSCSLFSYYCNFFLFLSYVCSRPSRANATYSLLQRRKKKKQ